MRADGSTVPDPREWSPSPVWPNGRDLFLLRPLLALSRVEIRAALAAEGETWLEDPANADLRYARARARAGGGGKAAVPPPIPPSPAFTADAAGVIRLPRDVSALALAAALLCAAGTDRPPRGERLDRLIQRLRAGEVFVATLAGARLETDRDGVAVCRDAGETARGGLKPLFLSPCETGVWDGRWEITAGEHALEVVALKGRMSRLSPEQRAAVSVLPAAARPALPLVLRHGAAPWTPALDGAEFAVEGGGRARLLVPGRFRAAVGLYDQESVTRCHVRGASAREPLS